MKLLFVFTGGTIGSTANSDVIFIDNEKPYLLIEKYSENHKIDFEYDTVEPYLTLSENSTGKMLKKLCECVKANLNHGYDGIIVTHGTDTLQYSASALAYIAGSNSIPVCLVSSNFILEDERSNALFNLHGAIEFIRKGAGKGVFVSYKNTNDLLRIHRASRLLSSTAFSDDVFSVRDEYYGYFDETMNFVKNPDYSECEDAMAPLSADTLTSQSDGILRLEPYVGMVYPSLSDSVRYIIFGSYHSGTINTASSAAKVFFEEAHKRGIPVFLTGIYGGKSYESTESFDALHIMPLVNISPISAYIKLWLCKDCDNTVTLMSTPLGSDV